MKKIIRFTKKISLFQYVVSFATIIAFVLQCIDIPTPYKSIIASIVIILTIVCIIIDVVNVKKKNVLNRKMLVTHTQNLMSNSTGKVVMFGGDLSWTEDYIETIKHLTNNNQIVEIIYPKDKIRNSKRSVCDRFEKNVKQLKVAGAKVYFTDKDYHLRCTLVDVGSTCDNGDLKIISSKRIHRNLKNADKNQYKTYLFENSNENDKILCESFYQNYELIRQIYKEH